MSEDKVRRLLERRSEVAEEIRSRLGLPQWSNLRGDDVIMLVEGLDEASRVRLNGLFVELREIEDERAAG
jgi:hypothetical protein